MALSKQKLTYIQELADPTDSTMVMEAGYTAETSATLYTSTRCQHTRAEPTSADNDHIGLKSG
jgi:hypothetical protein